MQISGRKTVTYINIIEAGSIFSNHLQGLSCMCMCSRLYTKVIVVINSYWWTHTHIHFTIDIYISKLVKYSGQKPTNNWYYQWIYEFFLSFFFFLMWLMMHIGLIFFLRSFCLFVRTFTISTFPSLSHWWSYEFLAFEKPLLLIWSSTKATTSHHQKATFTYIKTSINIFIYY